MGHGLPMGRSRLDGRPAWHEPAGITDFGIRAASGLLEACAGRRRAFPDIPRVGPAISRLSSADGFYACRIHAGDGASLLWVLGLPDHGVLRTDQSLRQPPGFHVPDRLSAPARDRGYSGLGPLTLSDGRSRSRLF